MWKANECPVLSRLRLMALVYPLVLLLVRLFPSRLVSSSLLSLYLLAVLLSANDAPSRQSRLGAPAYCLPNTNMIP